MKAQGWVTATRYKIVTPWFSGLLHGQFGISAWAQGLWTGLVCPWMTIGVTECCYGRVCPGTTVEVDG